MYGDLAAVTKLEARFAEVFPRGESLSPHTEEWLEWMLTRSLDSPLKRLAQRFTYNGVDQIGIRELGLGRIAPPPPPPTMGQPPHIGMPMPTGMGMGNGPPPPMPQAGPGPNGHSNGPGNQYQNPHPRPPSPIRQRSRSPPPIRRGRPSRSPSFSQGPPGNKRYRPSPSYNAPPPPRDRDLDNHPAPVPRNRYPSGGSGGAPPFVSAPPPMPMPMPRASPVPVPVQAGDPSGLAPALPWFIAKLPNNRSFDGMFASLVLMCMRERNELIGQDRYSDQMILCDCLIISDRMAKDYREEERLRIGRIQSVSFLSLSSRDSGAELMLQPRDSHPLLWVLGDIDGCRKDRHEGLLEGIKGGDGVGSSHRYQHVCSTASHGSSSYHQGTDLPLLVIIEWIGYFNVTD